MNTTGSCRSSQALRSCSVSSVASRPSALAAVASQRIVQSFTGGWIESWSCDAPCTRTVAPQPSHDARSIVARNNRRIAALRDCRFGWWGLGNNLRRWLSLLRVGLASGRATFLWMSERATSDDGRDSEHTRKEHGIFFDLGEYFVGVGGVDWRWSRATERQVRQRMARLNVSGPINAQLGCSVDGVLGCQRHWLSWDGATLTGDESDEYGGSLVRWMGRRAEPWLLLTLARRGHMTALQPSSSYAAVLLSGQRPDCTALGASTRPSCADPTSPVEDRIGHGSPHWWPPANSSDSGKRVTARFQDRCEVFSLLRPTRTLQLLLAPVVAILDRLGGAVVALHLRSGYPDWVALAALPDGSSRLAWRTAAERPLLPAEAHWAQLEANLLDCNATAYAPGRPCFYWRAPRGRAPTLEDAYRGCRPRYACS